MLSCYALCTSCKPFHIEPRQRSTNEPLILCNCKAVKWLLLQCLPGLSCLTAMILVSYILYTISCPTAWNFNTLSPQGVVVVVCACGIGALCVTLVMLPGDVKRAKLRAPTLNPVKHMNLLGLV